jgi:type II secretory pathway predicted ATPase ExeA
MLSEVRNYFGITREISSIGQFAYFETTQLQQLVAEIKLVIRESTLIVLAGIVGTGKTTMLGKRRLWAVLFRRYSSAMILQIR